MLDAKDTPMLLEALRLERRALLDLLADLDAVDWTRPTECPAYTVAGIAAHVLGDDLSLLSRQRDEAPSGLIAVAAELPGADFRTLLDSFNDRWVTAASFFSPRVLIDLLAATGSWTDAYWTGIDPEAPGEPVALFGFAAGSPTWQSIAREFLERWTHHAQICRALDRPAPSATELVAAGAAIVGAIAHLELDPAGAGGGPGLGGVALGPLPQATAVLTRGLPSEDLRALLAGPEATVEVLAAICGRP